MKIENLTSNKEELKNSYFRWLAEIVENRKYDETFLRWLHTCFFIPTFGNDDNRASDGIYLRYEFENFSNFNEYTSLSGPCTMLEMLVALAKRMDFNINAEEKYEKWFWMLVKNLGLHVFNSNDPEIKQKMHENAVILKNFVDRKYESNGEGGLFPLRYPKGDQRRIEIWYQMMAYLEENNL